MAKQHFDFKKTEEKIRKFWEKEKIYKFDSKSKKKIYSIDTPPPYLSGKMHIGHTFSYSQQDLIARFRRMNGENILYPFGTDDNGLPTERYVEKLHKIKSKSMSRADFIELCLKTLKKLRPDFIQDFKNLGLSCDWEIYYSTIDKNAQKISQKSFIDLYKQKEVYKEKFPTLWCTDCHTSIAQAELEDKQENTLFSTLKFKVGSKDLLIATTRPELLGACVAVFVNPKDKRYKNLIGKKAKVPLFDFEVPILKDESAEMEKGTGVLMICSYGDKYDVEAIQKHKLKPKVIFDTNGKLNTIKYKELKIKEARKKILEDLEKANLIKKQEEITNVMNVHERCGVPIEFIPTEQWFIKILDKKKKLIEQGRKVKWHPEFMQKRYENWVNGLEWDWSISRERHFGVPIPVWECKKCNTLKGTSKIILPEEKELPIDPLQVKKKCPKCKEYAEGERRVLDTWATSSMTPQITASLINHSHDLFDKSKAPKIRIPFSFRPQGHDIIRTWAFYTIVKSYLQENKIPWNDVMISGMVSLKGKKMSKSKGNVIDPKEIMEKYGSDALRFWAASSKLGEDTDYQEKELVTGKKLVNKLLNASKFVFMNLEGFNGKKPKKRVGTDIEFDEEIQHLIKNVTGSFNRYNYSVAKSRTEDFFWRYFTFYIELVKGRIYNEKGDKKLSAQYTLYQSLLTILKLMAPIMPFITEEIYQKHFSKYEKNKSIHLTKWPKSKEDTQSSSYLRMAESLYLMINQERTKNKKSMNSEIILTLESRNIRALNSSGMRDDFKNMVHAKEIKEGKEFNVEFI